MITERYTFFFFFHKSNEACNVFQPQSPHADSHKSRRQWLQSNQPLLRMFLSYCSLHGSHGGGLASVRMELILLLQESHQVNKPCADTHHGPLKNRGKGLFERLMCILKSWINLLVIKNVWLFLIPQSWSIRAVFSHFYAPGLKAASFKPPLHLFLNWCYGSALQTSNRKANVAWFQIVGENTDKKLQMWHTWWHIFWFCAPANIKTCYVRS